jgi:hypothetical protein
LRQRVCAIAADADVDLPARKSALQGRLHRGIVFDQQQFHASGLVFSPM